MAFNAKYNKFSKPKTWHQAPMIRKTAIGGVVLIVFIVYLVAMKSVSISNGPQTPMIRSGLSVTTAPTQLQYIPTNNHIGSIGAGSVEHQPPSTTKPNRVYCMVPSMYEQNRLRLWSAILRTWGKGCDIIKFFVDPIEGQNIPATFAVPESDMVADIVVVPMVRKNGGICGDGQVCRHIWEKVWRSWVYVAQHDINSAEWFLKVDDDSYLIASNLRKYVREKGWSADDTHYFGHYVFITGGGVDLISGTLTAFSRATIKVMDRIYNSMDHEYGPRDKFKHNRCVDRDGATEEKTTSICLYSAGIYAEDTVDEEGREHVVPLGIPFTLTYKRKPTTTSWYWAGKPQSRGDRQQCCSFSAWGIHGYKSSARMLEMGEMMNSWTLEKVTSKMDMLSEDDDEHWHLWYIRELRLNILRDIPNQLARGDTVSDLYMQEYDKYVVAVDNKVAAITT